jgi:hypothetical protein
MFSPSRAFVAQYNVFGNPGNYIRVEQGGHQNSASLGQGPALPANIKLGLKSSLSYFEHVYIIDAKDL